MYLNQEKRMMINGALQYILLLAEHKDLPLLIYVHGGPGDAALPLLLHYQKELASKYTLVLWEQRGAGKSYYEFGQYENLLLDDYVQDLHEIVQYVLKRFHQEKVYLCAHDFGTIIGFLFFAAIPTIGPYVYRDLASRQYEKGHAFASTIRDREFEADRGE